MGPPLHIKMEPSLHIKAKLSLEMLPLRVLHFRLGALSLVGPSLVLILLVGLKLGAGPLEACLLDLY